MSDGDGDERHSWSIDAYVGRNMLPTSSNANYYGRKAELISSYVRTADVFPEPLAQTVDKSNILRYQNMDNG